MTLDRIFACGGIDDPAFWARWGRTRRPRIWLRVNEGQFNTQNIFVLLSLSRTKEKTHEEQRAVEPREANRPSRVLNRPRYRRAHSRQKTPHYRELALSTKIVGPKTLPSHVELLAFPMFLKKQLIVLGVLAKFVAQFTGPILDIGYFFHRRLDDQWSEYQ